MAIKQINIIMALLKTANCRILMEQFSGFVKERIKFSHELGKIEFVHDRKDLSEKLEAGDFNIAFVMEKLNGDSIGQGTLKNLRSTYTDTRFILIMDNSKVASMKVNTLYEKEYYDGLFSRDVGSSEMLNLLYKGRTREEAYEYYKINILEKEREKRNIEREEAASQKQDSFGEAPLLKENSKEVSVDVVKSSSIHSRLSSDNKENKEMKQKQEKSHSKDAISPNRQKKEAEQSEKAENGETAFADINNHPKKTLQSGETSQGQGGLEKSIGGSREEKQQEKEQVVEINRQENVRKKEGRDRKKTQESELESFDDPVATPSHNRENKRRVYFEEIRNNQGTDIDIMGQLHDEECIRNYMDSVIRESKINHKENKDYEVIDNQGFIKTLDEFEYRSVRALDDVLMGNLDIRAFLEQHVGPFINQSKMSKEKKQEAQDIFFSFVFGYDVLESLIAVEEISDIHAVNYNTIRVKKNNQRNTSLISFCNEKHYLRFIKNLLLRNSGLLTSDGLSKTYVDKKYDSKYILTVTIIDESISSFGVPELIIRKSRHDKLTLDKMIGDKMTLKEAAIIASSIQKGEGILLCGPNGCGATTLINGMLECIPRNKNAVVMQYKNELFVNNHPEITIWHPIVGRSGGNKGRDITMPVLCETALELDSDYYILGDIKGKEAYSLYKAANSGYIIWTMVRASSCDSALYNLCDMIHDSHPVLDKRAILDLLISKFKLIVYMENNKIREMKLIKGRGYDLHKRTLDAEVIS